MSTVTSAPSMNPADRNLEAAPAAQTPIKPRGRAQQAGQKSQQKFQNVAKDDQQWEDLAFALTGKTADQRTTAENRVLKQLRQEIREGKIDPEVVVAGPANGSGSDKLPAGVRGAYVTGGDGEQGRVLISDGLRGQQLQSTSDEEQGEAVADRAAQLGIGVADGDAGARISGVANGQTVTKDSNPDLFTDQDSDTIEVMSDGQVVEAEADAGAQPMQNIEIWFRKDAKDDTEVWYFHEGEWHRASTKSDGNEESGYTTAQIPADVSPEHIAVKNTSTGDWLPANGANAKNVITPNGTDLHFEDRKDGDDSFDDVNIRMTGQTVSVNAPDHNGNTVDMSTNDGQAQYLASFDGSDGTAPDGQLSKQELINAGVPEEKADRLTRLYGTASDNGSFSIPTSTENSGVEGLDGVGINAMIDEGVLTVSGTGASKDYGIEIDFNRVSGSTFANAMIRSEAARRKVDGTDAEKAMTMSELIWDVSVNGMTAGQMDTATDVVFGDRDAMNGDHAKAITQNFGLPFKSENGGTEQRMTKASLEAAFTNGAIEPLQDGGHFISFNSHTDVRAPGEFFDQELSPDAEADTANTPLPPDEGHMHLSFTTDEPVTVYANVRQANGSIKQVKVYTHKAGGPETVHIDVPLEPGQTVEEIWVGGPNGERRPSQPGPGMPPPWPTTQTQADGTVTQYYETSDGSAGSDYNDVVINWAPPGTTYRRHATQYDRKEGLPANETYETNVRGAATADPDLQLQYWDPGTGTWQPMLNGPSTITQDNTNRSTPPQQPQLRVFDTRTNKVVAGAEVPGSVKTIQTYDGGTTTYFDVNLGDGRPEPDLIVTTRPQGSVSGASGLPPHIVQGRYVPVPEGENHLVPETPVGHVTTDSTPNEVAPTLPTDEQEHEMRQQGEATFLDVLANQPEGSNGKTLYNLLVAKSMVTSGQYKGEVNLAQIEKDIETYFNKPDVQKLMQDTNHDVAQDVMKEDPTLLAEEAAADLTSPEVKTALANMPPEEREAFIQDAVRKLALLDPEVAAQVQHELTVNALEGVAVEDLSGHLNDLADSADAKEARGEVPTPEEKEAQQAVEAAALDTFDHVVSFRGAGSALGTVGQAAVSTWAKQNPQQARKVLAQYTQNLQNGMPVEQAMTHALESQGVPKNIKGHFSKLAKTNLGLTILGGLGAAFSILAVAQDAIKASGGENLTTEDKLDFAADVLASAGAIVTTGKGFNDFRTSGKTPSTLKAVAEFEAAHYAFHAEFAAYKRADQAHSENVNAQTEAEREAEAADAELAASDAELERLNEEGGTEVEFAAAEQRNQTAVDRATAADKELDLATENAEASGSALEAQKQETQNAYNLAKKAQKTARDTVTTDPLAPPEARQNLNAELTHEPADPETGLRPRNAQENTLWDSLDHNEWRDASVTADAEAPTFATRIFALKTLGLVSSAGDIMYGINAAKSAEEFAEMGDTEDAAVESLKAVGLLGGAAAGLFEFGASAAGFEAAAVSAGPVGIAFGAVFAVGWAAAKVYEKHRATVLQQESEKEFINGTGTGKTYAT